MPKPESITSVTLDILWIAPAYLGFRNMSGVTCDGVISFYLLIIPTTPRAAHAIISRISPFWKSP